MATVTALSSLYRVGDVADPPTAEKLRHQVCSDGLALFDGAYDVEAMLAVTRRIMYMTAHPDSDDRRVTTIVDLGPAADQPNARGFSRRELMAHTDRSAVPDPPGLMMLTCASRPESAVPTGSPMAWPSMMIWPLPALSPCRRSAVRARCCSAVPRPPRGGLHRCPRPRTGPGRDPVASRRSCVFLTRRRGVDPQLAASINRHTLTVTLQPGQGVLLDNYRWLHARDTFEGPRQLYRVLGNPLPSLGMYPGIPVKAGGEMTLGDVTHQFQERWDIAAIPQGYRAVPRETGGWAPVVLYGRTPAELAESIRTAEGAL